LYITKTVRYMTKTDFLEDALQKFSVYLNHCGECSVTREWWLAQALRMQRLYYIRQGSGYYTLGDGSRMPFEAGKIYVHPYNLHDEFYSSPNDPIDHVFFDFITTPPIISPEPLIYDVPDGSSLAAMIELLSARYREAGLHMLHQLVPEQRLLFASLLESLLWMLHLTKPLPFSDDSALCDTLEYIRKHYAEPLNIAGLASMAGYDSNYFIRRFKDVMGITPYAYLRAYRLLKAGELIGAGYTFAQAAESVGYENASSLSRALSASRSK